MQASKTLKHGHLNDRTEQGRGSDTVQYLWDTVPFFACLLTRGRPVIGFLDPYQTHLRKLYVRSLIV
jgi:hypothetical protein